MDRKEALIGAIVRIEWEMFREVPNAGGTAACQQDIKTFEIMRSSQAVSWSEAALDSYLGDLEEAKRSGRNLLTEKYARMMESTSPSEYARIAHLLPPLDPAVPELIEEIVRIVLEWEDELAARFPRVVERGRPIRSSGDTPFATSLESYLRGELSTCSRRTLELHRENVAKQKAEGVNGSEVTLLCMVKRYGFGSLEEANAHYSANPVRPRPTR